MANTIHETEENILRSAVVMLNKMNVAGFDDTAVAAVTTKTNAGLQTAIAGSDSAVTFALHETNLNYSRQANHMVQKMFDLRVGMDAAVAVDGVSVTMTTATSGGTLLDSTLYYIKVVAVDSDGNLSAPSAQVSKQTGSGGAGNAHVIKAASLTPVPGAVSYQVYFSATTGVFTLGYKAVTKSNMEGSTGVTFTSISTGLTAGTIPTVATATAVTPVLNNDDVLSAVTTGTFAALKGKVTGNSNYATAVTSLDAGEQAMA